MFDYLIKLYLQEEKEHFAEQSGYWWTRGSFFNLMQEKFANQINDTPENNPRFWVNFYMAWAIKSLIVQYVQKGIGLNSSKIEIGPAYPIPSYYSIKHSWTAFMILGMILPNKKFGSQLLYEYGIEKKILQEEEGYISRFSSRSLYETVFKKYLNEEDIKLYLKCTSIKETRPARIHEKRKEILKKIIELDDATTNLQKIKALLDNTAIQQSKEKWSEYTDSDANINVQEENGHTALIQVVRHKKYQIAEHLLNLGADPLIENCSSEIASDLVPSDSPFFRTLKNFELLYATLNKDFMKVRSILNEGGDVNFQGFGGYSALLIAIEQDSADIVEFLLLSGADLSLTRADGQGAFELVTNTDVFIILQKATVEADLPDGEVELEEALEDELEKEFEKELKEEETSENEIVEDKTKNIVTNQTQKNANSFFSSESNTVPEGDILEYLALNHIEL
ncbi:ankyrin repeat domain-containing protein [Legionella drancourtii]|uniref:Uncharacterized protein n=1 Tax=Legionella drancourtii LLAP12 TaxID=658187 RepID=G9EMF3_9GAMM|nr:ankyrin repeat domain-containing protein [Legionella drancourtii]EHL31489.1 hypothetical protein LDG_6419 [Legionella drancourtii LLAP12]